MALAVAAMAYLIVAGARTVLDMDAVSQVRRNAAATMGGTVLSVTHHAA